MYDPMTDVMLRAVADRQARLRERDHLFRAFRAHRPTSPSRVRRMTGEVLIRLGEHIRGELRDSSPSTTRPRMATR